MTKISINVLAAAATILLGSPARAAELEIVALVSCFIDLQTGQQIHCRITNNPGTIYYSQEVCERAKRNLKRDDQCFGGCDRELGANGDVVDKSYPGQKRQTRYSCWKMLSSGGWERAE